MRIGLDWSAGRCDVRLCAMRDEAGEVALWLALFAAASADGVSLALLTESSSHGRVAAGQGV